MTPSGADAVDSSGPPPGTYMMPSSYPVPPVPVPEPWWPWRPLRRWVTRGRTARLRQALAGWTKAAENLERHLQTAIALHETERALERVRNWNTALLKEKAEHRAALAEHQATLAETQQRAVNYLVERDEAHGRIRYLERELEDTVRSRNEMEADLKRVLGRCDDLAAKLRERKKR